ncbi:patatin-like phospholipase family protein [Fusobacterium ulcerans]|uniref:patatin-like phospholipase family protein n=1 Tax=Fusobacterium ulcerans TaxID=861 RepID=UPI001E2AE6E9|nr:patatin-like phospholipase family protein [Fusobacterium ulcerans]
MGKKDVKIGVALSGGGIRATIFHLGLFKWLAENELMENIKHISSVSGASIAIGLIYTYNNMKWPTSREYLEEVLPNLKTAMLKEDVQNKTLITS